MPTIELRYEQFRHCHHAAESHTTAYESYENAVIAAHTYFEGRSGRFPNEVCHITLNGTHMHTCHYTELCTVLRTHKDEIAVRGKTCKLYLTLDGTTKYGMPRLQCVTFAARVASRDAAREAERLALYGICNGCNSADCDHDCGILSCGCIDICRGYCGLGL